MNECDKFEKGLGTIMRNAWLHVEVLQTTDLPALVHHIADVFEAVLDMPQVTEGLIRQGDLHQRQEVLVFYYLYGVLRHIEEIGEHRCAHSRMHSVCAMHQLIRSTTLTGCCPLLRSEECSCWQSGA